MEHSVDIKTISMFLVSRGFLKCSRKSQWISQGVSFSLKLWDCPATEREEKKYILHPWNWCCQSSLYCPSLVLKPHRPGKADRSAILRWIYYEIAWCNWSKKIRGKKCCNERALFHGPHIIATGQEGDGRSVKVKYGWRTFPVKIMFHFQKEITVKYICL